MSDLNTTVALLVGIESYQTGRDWNLNGPAADVVRMAQWLTNQGVPSENLHICISPLKPIESLRGYHCVGANQEDILNELGTIREQSASLFIFYWGGHGWVESAGDRRLFYADAQVTDWRNLDFNDLLVTMRTDLYQGMPKQLFIVDTCANYAQNLGIKPPRNELARGEHPIVYEQFVLFAGKLGDRATNLNAEQTGLYTRELLQELGQSQGAWPPDVKAISESLASRFIDLRNQGLTEQTPTYLWHRDWLDNDEYYAQMSTSATSQAIVNLPRRLEIRETVELRNLFLRCDSFSDRQRRDGIINMLRPEIARNISRGDDANTEFLSIFNTVRNYKGGLKELLDAIEFYEEDSIPFQALKQGIKRILPREID
jgi:hypothetical protein